MAHNIGNVFGLRGEDNDIGTASSGATDGIDATGTGTGERSDRATYAGNGRDRASTGEGTARPIYPPDAPADTITLEQGEPAEPTEERGPTFSDLFNAVASSMRGGKPAPDRPPRGAEKIASTGVQDLIDLVSGVMESRLGDEAGIKPAERMLIANGASRYLPPSLVGQVAKWIGPLAILTGLGLWAWRCIDLYNARKPTIPPAQLAADMIVYQQAAQQAAQQAQPASPPPNPALAQMAPYPGVPAQPNRDWRTIVER